MIRSHILGTKEMVSGRILDHTYNFYDETGVEDMRIVEQYLYDGKFLNDPKLYRKEVVMADPKTHMIREIYVDGERYNNRHHARSLYKMLLGMGYISYTA
jgi:hypothetical protein